MKRLTLRLLKHRVVLAALVAALFCIQSHAQDFRATLTGLVTDPSGAVIGNATVTAINSDSKTSYTGKTSGKGVYYIPYVLPGTYTVTAKANGFNSVVQENVLLLASQTFNQNFTLEVGSVSQQVVVDSAPAQLETTTGSGGTVLDQRTLQSVPLNGGQSYTLVGTTPGSQFTQTSFGTSGSHGTTGYDSSNSYTIGGGIVGNNQFTLNGSNITSQYTYNNHGAGEWSVSPNIDSIQEVNVMTTTYDARYGRTSGGTVNVVSKSGGDQYHGSARYAYEGSLMNANTFQNNLTGTPRQGEVQNQFWITAGGPIIKNKLFFFFGFEGYRQSLSGTTLENVAPAYLRPGYNGNSGVDFSLVQKLDPQEFPNGIPIYQPGTASCLDGGPATSCSSDHVAQQQFAGNAIPGSMVNSTANAVLKYIPLPNIPGAENLARGSNYISQTPDRYEYNQPQIRVDYNLTDKTKLYSYFMYVRGTENRNQNGLPGPAANGNINYVHQNWVATQDVTHVFSPTLVGDFKVSFNRFYESSPDGDLSSQTDPQSIGLGMPLPGTTSSKYLPEFKITDGWGTGFLSNNPANNNQIFGNNLNADVTNNFTFDADFTKTAGAHTFEFGGEIDEFQYGGVPDGGGHPNGYFGFSSAWTQFNPHNSSCYPLVPGAGNSNTCSANNPNGSSLASFYLGLPAAGDTNHSNGIDWFNSIMEGYPVYAIYFQDNWRVNSRLTLNLGLRYDVQRGLRERYNHLNRGLCFTCVNPLTNEASYQTNVANAANVAAWTAAGINPSSLDTVYGGVEFAGSNGQSRDAYNTDWSDVGPRIGFAFVIDPKTVVRGGWGLMYSYGLEGGSSIGENQTTNYTASTDGGNTPTNYFQGGAPFQTGLLSPTGNSQGLLTDVGNGTIQADFPNRKVPMEQIVSLGVQRELPGGMVLDARYAGNFSSRLRVNLWLNGTATLAEQKAAQANPQIWDQQVPNPYYGVAGMSGPGQCGTSTTVMAIALTLPGSQYCSPGGYGLIGQYNAPLGRNWYDGLEVKLTKRATRGLTLNLAYTYSKTMNGDGYLNGWPYQNPFQIHQLANTDRTHILSLTSVWDLPLGKGGMFLTSPSRPLGMLINNWSLSSVFNAQSGVPVQVNTGWYYSCPGASYRPQGGTSVGKGRWFGNDLSCWQGIPAWGLMNLIGTTAQVRQPTIPNLDLSIQKSTPLRENLTLDLRLDAFNALNSVLFGGPDNNPGDGPASFSPATGWSGFGTVGPQQQNFPRILQITGKISF
ncbi:MAG TPA: TonB-dependent receptor [Pseudacidobacterium sp.]|nr:TonB-dependent receptor [Pseudacidobacterium sp.]